MSKITENRIFRIFFRNYEDKKQSLFQVPFPLQMKCLLIAVGSVVMLIMGIVIAVTSESIKPAIAGTVLALAFFSICAWHYYLFTRKRYVRVFAYVARRERSTRKFSKEISTFIIFPDGSERELLLGNRKLNIGGEYAFYFGETNGTPVPNCNIMYGYEPASDVDKRAHEEAELQEQLEALVTTDSVEATGKVVDISEYLRTK